MWGSGVQVPPGPQFKGSSFVLSDIALYVVYSLYILYHVLIPWERMKYEEDSWNLSNTGFLTHFGPIDYRLGRQVFILESRVRFPVGLQNLGVIILDMSGSKQTIGYSVMGTGTVIGVRD